MSEEKYIIPVMAIQGSMVELEKKDDYIILIEMLEEVIKYNKTNWGIEGKGYEIKLELENRWYPVFHFDNVWLANAFMEVVSTCVTFRNLSERFMS